MKPTLVSAGALVVLAIFVATLAAAQEPRPERESGALRRLEPSDEARDPNRLEDLFARDFDRELWKQRLAEPDLERREKSLDALLRRARLDPAARAFLEELARAPAGGELAWTARLALRELGRARFPLQGPGAGPLGVEPFTGMQNLQQMMNELFAQDGFGRVLPHAAPGTRGALGQGRRVELEQGNGQAVLRITETLEGQESTRRYVGASLEEILVQHPELKEELGALSLQLGQGPRRIYQGERVVPLVPQERSRPVLTDRLGVIVQPLGAARGRELGLEGGLLVERAVPESYAHLLGVGAGDVLLELDGVPLRSGEDIERRMRARQADDALTLVWLDGLGQRQEKTWRAPDPAAKPR